MRRSFAANAADLRGDTSHEPIPFQVARVFACGEDVRGGAVSAEWREQRLKSGQSRWGLHQCTAAREGAIDCGVRRAAAGNRDRQKLPNEVFGFEELLVGVAAFRAEGQVSFAGGGVLGGERAFQEASHLGMWIDVFHAFFFTPRLRASFSLQSEIFHFTVPMGMAMAWAIS